MAIPMNKSTQSPTAWQRVKLAIAAGADLIGYAFGTTYTNGTVGKHLQSVPVVVNSIAALKALSKNGNPWAIVTGYYTKGDGGGGVYFYDSADVTTADDGGVNIVATDGGRWKLSSQTQITFSTFGCKCNDPGDGTGNDDSVAAQLAVNYALANKIDLAIDGRRGLMRIATPLVYNRAVDSAAADAYFNIIGINGGGIVISSAMAMFTSSLTFAGTPVAQMLRLERLVLKCTDKNLAAYVFDRNLFMRSVIQSCSMIGVKAFNATGTTETQSVSLLFNNVRRFEDSWVKGATTNFAFYALGNIVEAGEQGIDLSSMVGGALAFNTIEGMTAGTAITVNGSQGLFAAGNYHEANTGASVDFASGSHLGMLHAANYYSHGVGDAAVNWGTAENVVSLGNYAVHNLHALTANSKIAIRDYAVTQTTDRSGQSEVPFNVPVIDAYATAAQTPVVTATFTKVTLGTEVIDTNAEFATSRHTPKVPGYYRYEGRVNFTPTGGGATLTRCIVAIFKNGVEAFRLVDMPTNTTSAVILSGACEVLMNGTTDYIELYGYMECTGTPTFGAGSIPEASRLGGHFVRSPGV